MGCPSDERGKRARRERFVIISLRCKMKGAHRERGRGVVASGASVQRDRDLFRTPRIKHVDNGSVEATESKPLHYRARAEHLRRVRVPSLEQSKLIVRVVDDGTGQGQRRYGVVGLDHVEQIAFAGDREQHLVVGGDLSADDGKPAPCTAPCLSARVGNVTPPLSQLRARGGIARHMV